MLTLYRFAGATCAGKVLIALSEKQVAFEGKVIDRADLALPWYRELNPNGVVPTIVHDGINIIESSIILQYIDDAFDGRQLTPSTALGRAQMRHWLKLTDDALSSLATITYSIAARRMYLAQSVEMREAYYSSIPDHLARQSRRNAIELGLDAPEVPNALSLLMGLQRGANKATAEGGFLVGDYSLADIALTPLVSRLDALGLLASKEDLPTFHRWWKAVRNRPSFAEGITDVTPAEILTALRAASDAEAERLTPLWQQVQAAG